MIGASTTHNSSTLLTVMLGRGGGREGGREGGGERERERERERDRERDRERRENITTSRDLHGFILKSSKLAINTHICSYWY